MDGIIRLSRSDRKTAVEYVQRHADHRAARRAHVLLLLADGHATRSIAAVLFCSFDLIAAVRRDYRRGGLPAALGTEPPPVRRVPWWWGRLLVWALEFTPGDFGFRRSRWSCVALAVALRETIGVRVGRETVRRILGDLGFVWRRPRPVVGPADPDHAGKMRALRRLLGHLPANEVAVYQDEVQLDLNPKIGSAWMLRGHQAEVVTPGDNVRRHLAVSQVIGTGTLVASAPTKRRNSGQFVAHLEELCRRLRRWRVIHVICDNASFHKSWAVRRWVRKRGGRVVLHYLPSRAPEENPVERVFWRLHEAVTRNHRFETIEELVRAAVEWLEREGRMPPVAADYSLAA
jgi:putative transposase